MARAHDATIQREIWPADGMSQASFCALVWEQGRQHKRDLPWRYLDDPYAVLVSEVMLQQTQVARVQGRWERFMRKFPTLDALVAASVSDVLEEWQGMGYNRRALSLQRAAEACALQYAGRLPQTYEALLELPGVGPATAAGVMAFAYDKPAVYLETNVRTVFLHEFFPDVAQVSDKQLIPLVKLVCPSHNVRAWYYALLDYGAYLKATVGNASRRSAHYSKQSKFEGSYRQKRANLVRIVLNQPGISVAEAQQLLNQQELQARRPQVGQDTFQSLVYDLVHEGFFCLEGDCLRVY